MGVEAKKAESMAEQGCQEKQGNACNFKELLKSPQAQLWKDTTHLGRTS